MSFCASGAQIIFADIDGALDATFAMCPVAVVVGPCGVVGLEEGFALPPQDASTRAMETDAGTTSRMRTARGYRFASRTAGRVRR